MPLVSTSLVFTFVIAPLITKAKNAIKKLIFVPTILASTTAFVLTTLTDHSNALVQPNSQVLSVRLKNYRVTIHPASMALVSTLPRVPIVLVFQDSAIWYVPLKSTGVQHSNKNKVVPSVKIKRHALTLLLIIHVVV